MCPFNLRSGSFTLYMRVCHICRIYRVANPHASFKKSVVADPVVIIIYMCAGHIGMNASQS